MLGKRTEARYDSKPDSELVTILSVVPLTGRWKGFQDPSDSPLPSQTCTESTLLGELLTGLGLLPKLTQVRTGQGREPQVEPAHQSQALTLHSPSKFTQQRPLVNATQEKVLVAQGTPLL